MYHQPLIRRICALEFETQVLTKCQQPGASIAAIAPAHELNSDVLHNESPTST